MVRNNEKIANSIQVVAAPHGGFVLSITADAMVELMPVFEEEASYSNGPAWEALIEYLISIDSRAADFELDSEGDAALARCATRLPLDRFRSILIEASLDEQKLRGLIRKGRAAGFGHGDL